MPFLLFVPSYGRGGSGEFVRAVTLAQAVAQRWPALRIEFLLPGGPGTRQDAPFPATCHEGPEASKGVFDNETLRRLRPDIAIFDSGCRTSTLRLCRQLGIRSIFVSDRAGTRRKAFRLDWLRLLDQHWHQREHYTATAFTRTQRLRGLFGRTQRLCFDTYLAEPPPDDSDLPEPARTRLRQPFVLFAPGGGGYRIDGYPVSDLYAAAAARVHAVHGIECLTLLGALYAGSATATEALVLRQVSQGRFVDLLRRAQIVVCNGGHSLNQALACAAVCAAAPLGGGDQPERIAAYAEAGLIRAAMPALDSLFDQVSALLEPAHAAAQRKQLMRLDPINGIPVMCDALGQLLHTRPR